MMRVAREKRAPRPSRRHAQQVINYECTIFNRCTDWFFNHHHLAIYLILLALISISTTTKAAQCEQVNPPLQFINGDKVIYYCPPGFYHKLPDNECRAAIPCETSTEIENSCAQGFDRIDGDYAGGFVCFHTCPIGEFRVYDPDGLPENRCQPPACEIWQQMNEYNQCEPLQCYNPQEELILMDSYPYRSCFRKCPVGEERDFDKYGDYGCYKPPVKCLPEETEINGECIKPPEPTACDPDSQWLFLCQWYEDFKNFVSDIHTYFSELLNKQDQIHSENKEFQTQVLQKLDNQNPTGNGSGTSIVVPDHSASDRQTIIQNQEKQLTQDKDFQHKTLEFYDWFKKEKEEEENPETPNNNSVVEEQNIQVDEQQRVNWSASCPMNEAPKELSLNGLPPVSIGFDNYELCTMAQKMRPLILLAGAFISMLIIAGGLRK